MLCSNVFNCVEFMVNLKFIVFVCYFVVCLVHSLLSNSRMLWLLYFTAPMHRSTHWPLLTAPCCAVLCCAGHVRLILCTLVVQCDCCSCFCPVRKAFVDVIDKLVLPVNVIVVTVAVFHQCQIKLLFLFLRLTLPLSSYLKLYFLFVCGTNCFVCSWATEPQLSVVLLMCC